MLRLLSLASRSRPTPRVSVAMAVGVAVAAVATATIFVVAAVIFDGRRAALEADALDHLNELGDVQAARAEIYFDRAAEAALLVASRTQLRSSLVSYIETGDLDALQRTREILLDAAAATAIVDAIAIVGSDGVVVTADDPTQVGSLVPRDHMTADGELRLGPVVETKSGQALLVSTSLDAAVEATIVVEVSVEPLHELASNAPGLGRSGETMVAQRLVDGDALFLTALLFDAEAAMQRTVASDAIEVPIIQALRGHRTITSDATDYRGVPVFAVSRPLGDTFGLVVKIDAAEALAPVDELRSNLIRATGLALVVAGLLAFWLSRVLTKPLRRLTQAAMAVAGGDRERRAQARGPRELVRLAHAVNSMTDDLVTANQHLREANRQLQTVNGRLAHLNRALFDRATHDPLTKLPNRVLLMDRLDRGRARSLRTGTWLGVLYLDLDGFKAVNDRLGHHAGDQVLIEVTDRLTRAVRAVDTVARIGGDEFVIVVDGLAGPDEVTRVASHVLDVVSRPIRADGEDTRVSASIGVLVASPQDAERISAAALLRKADATMYLAKRRGGHAWQMRQASDRFGAASVLDGAPATRH